MGSKKVLQWCPKIQNIVTLTLEEIKETKITRRGKVVNCDYKSQCSFKYDEFCWLDHYILTGKGRINDAS